MSDDPPVRPLTERTGRHFCIRCLALVPAERWFENDHICDACAEKDEYPLASTPEPKPEPKNDAP